MDLKILYKRHYRKEAKGGLQASVERVGLTFEGRAHDGLIDSRNTAAIAALLQPAFCVEKIEKCDKKNRKGFSKIR